mgnify:CR=1 FL=1
MEVNEFLNVPLKYSTRISIAPTSIHKLNPEFSLCDIDVMYINENRNGTDITKDVVEDAIYSLYGVPIVGEWLEEENRFGDHGEKIEITRDKITFKVTTKPIGFVTKDAVDNAEWIDKPLPNGHEMKTWLRLRKCILWTGRYEEAQSIIDNGTNQSMEVKFLDGAYKDNGYFKPSKMIFSALCAIGCEPCFEESNIRRAEYDLDSFKLEFSAMLDEYKKSKKDSTKQFNKEGVKQMELMKFVESLSQIKIDDTDENRYALLSVSDEKVHVLDLVDYKAYGFEYAVTTEEEDENLVIDFESKCEMSLSACDKITDEGFSEFSISDVIAAKAKEDADVAMTEFAKTVQSEYDAKIEEIRVQYNELDKSYKEAMEELARYKSVEAERAELAHKEEVDSIINEFSKKLSRVPEFLIYKARLDYSKSTDEIRKELSLMVGKSVMDSQSKSNFSYQPVSTAISHKTKSNDPTNRYGNLLDKYMK